MEEGEKEKQIHLNQSLDFLACILSTCDGKQNLKQFTENLGQDFYKTSKNQIFSYMESWSAECRSMSSWNLSLWDCNMSDIIKPKDINNKIM